MLIEITSEKQSKNILVLNDILVEVTTKSLQGHRSLTRNLKCHRGWDVDGTQDNGGWTNTIPIFIITLGTPSLHRKSWLYTGGYHSIHYINPLHCFHRQKYKHHKKSCKRKVTCPNCGAECRDGYTCSINWWTVMDSIHLFLGKTRQRYRRKIFSKTLFNHFPEQPLLIIISILAIVSQMNVLNFVIVQKNIINVHHLPMMAKVKTSTDTQQNSTQIWPGDWCGIPYGLWTFASE